MSRCARTKYAKIYIMQLKHYPVQELESEIKAIIGQKLDLNEYELFYFGSRVTDRGDEHSDIDIGIKGPKKVPLNILSEIEEDIEWIPTLYSIDVVDFNSVSDDMKSVALEKIEKII